MMTHFQTGKILLYLITMDKKILLIEDDESISFLYKRQLDFAGLPTDAFLTGNEGLAAASQKQYDFILLDIMLPDINGLDILKKLKENEVTKKIPVIFLTNLGQEETIKEGFKLGADGYLIKASFTPDQMVEEVKSLMQQFATKPQPAS